MFSVHGVSFRLTCTPRSRSGCALCRPVALGAARGQFSFSDQNSVSSVSGQFLVTSVADTAPLYRNLNPANTNVVQLKTALLAVAAERFKISLWRQLGLPADAPWSGKIHLRLHPAASPDETVTIVSTPFLNRWSYGVDLPDQLWKTRFARALSGVLLLEIANRAASPGGHACRNSRVAGGRARAAGARRRWG